MGRADLYKTFILASQQTQGEYPADFNHKIGFLGCLIDHGCAFEECTNEAIAHMSAITPFLWQEFEAHGGEMQIKSKGAARQRLDRIVASQDIHYTWKACLEPAGLNIREDL